MVLLRIVYNEKLHMSKNIFNYFINTSEQVDTGGSRWTEVDECG